MAPTNLVARSRRIAGASYERLLAPLGERAVRKMIGRGLPRQLEPAFRFLFSGQAPMEAIEAARTIEGLRARIAAGDETFSLEYLDTPLGVAPFARRAAERSGSETLNRYATVISVPKRWGLFLHLCASAFNARTILELGACVGISGAYLASIRSHPRLLTLEGSPALAQIAQATLAAVSNDAEVVVGTFEDNLSPALDRIVENQQRIDVAYVDGHHTEAATLHYVNRISRCLSSPALIILDDLYLYDEMWRAWQKLSSSAAAVSINVGRFGLLVYDSGAPHRHFDVSRYTGFWRVGSARW